MKKLSTKDNCSVFSTTDISLPWERFVPFFDKAWDVDDPVKRKVSRKVVIKNEVDGRQYYVKIYSRRHAKGVEHNLLRGSSLALFRSKAVKHMATAARLKDIGVGIAEPLIAIERRYGLIRQESMLVTPEYSLPSLSGCLKSAKKWDNFRPSVENVVQDIAKMHDAGFIHRDPHFGNVLVKDDMSVIWLDFGTVRKFRLRKKSFRDLRELYLRTVKMLSEWVDAPEELALELLICNYPHTDRVHEALRSSVSGFQ